MKKKIIAQVPEKIGFFRGLWINLMLKIGVIPSATEIEKKEKIFKDIKDALDRLIKSLATSGIVRSNNEYALKNYTLTIDEVNNHLLIKIEQPLAMSVKKSQWFYGGRVPITTNIRVYENGFEIERNSLEVLPVPSYTDPFRYSLLDMELEQTSRVYNFDFSMSGIKNSVDEIMSRLKVIMQENVKAQISNMLVNNADAEAE